MMHSPILFLSGKLFLVGKNRQRSGTLVTSSIPNHWLSFVFTIDVSNVDAFTEIFDHEQVV